MLRRLRILGNRLSRYSDGQIVAPDAQVAHKPPPNRSCQQLTDQMFAHHAQVAHRQYRKQWWWLYS